jgi:hypothetical protein
MLAALATGCACAAPPALAQPETAVNLHASFLPDRLGASTDVEFAVEFSGGEEGVPAPVRQAVLQLPAGLSIDLRGVEICAKARLQRSGAAGCPSGSIVGRGHALADVHAGSLTVPEEATVTVFRGPDRDGRRTFEIFGQGETPLYQSVISTAVLQPDSAPYGSKLTISVPAIPTLVYEPDASILSVSVTVGTAGHSSRTNAGSILMPRNCPAGGFPFAASFTFADGSTTSTSAAVGCP